MRKLNPIFIIAILSLLSGIVISIIFDKISGAIIFLFGLWCSLEVLDYLKFIFDFVKGIFLKNEGSNTNYQDSKIGYIDSSITHGDKIDVKKTKGNYIETQIININNTKDTLDNKGEINIADAKAEVYTRQDINKHFCLRIEFKIDGINNNSTPITLVAARFKCSNIKLGEIDLKNKQTLQNIMNYSWQDIRLEPYDRKIFYLFSNVKLDNIDNIQNLDNLKGEIVLHTSQADIKKLTQFFILFID